MTDICPNFWFYSFFLINVLFLFVIFIFKRLGSIAWEVLMRLKHGGDVDNFIVAITLVYASAFGSAFGFAFSDFKIDDALLIGIAFIFFLLMNVVVLVSTTFIGVYIGNEIGKYQATVMILLMLPFLALLFYEALMFNDFFVVKDAK